LRSVPPVRHPGAREPQYAMVIGPARLRVEREHQPVRKPVTTFDRRGVPAAPRRRRPQDTAAGTDPSRLDAEVAVRLRLTGHDLDAIARIIKDARRDGVPRARSCAATPKARPVTRRTFADLHPMTQRGRATRARDVWSRSYLVRGPTSHATSVSSRPRLRRERGSCRRRSRPRRGRVLASVRPRHRSTAAIARVLGHLGLSADTPGFHPRVRRPRPSCRSPTKPRISSPTRPPPKTSWLLR
jgi:hypothetical protein